MDSRLVRGLGKAEQEGLAQWLRESKGHLQTLVGALAADIGASQLQSDDREGWKGPNPVVEQAHAAGYREGLRAAIRLLSPKG